MLRWLLLPGPERAWSDIFGVSDFCLPQLTPSFPDLLDGNRPDICSAHPGA